MSSDNTSLARALRVLGAVLDHGEARVDELARHVETPVSTVYRYLRALRENGFVAEIEGVYRPGPRLVRERGAHLSHTDLRRLAHPTLQRLSELSGETALIAIRTTQSALCLDQVESPHAMRMTFRIGQQLPLHAGATSRTLLAHAPSEVVEAVLARLRETVDVDRLSGQLSTTRAAGITTSRAEFIPGAIAISVPVLDGDHCLCALTLAAPQSRGGAKWQHCAKDLLRAARVDLEALI